MRACVLRDQRLVIDQAVVLARHGRGTMGSMGKAIVAVISDLMFQSRLWEQAAALGYRVQVADTPTAVREALAGGPALVALDLHVDGLDWREAVASAKRAGVPVLAFGRHTEAALLRDARQAGCDRVVARSTLVEELPVLLEELAGAAL